MNAIIDLILSIGAIMIISLVTFTIKEGIFYIGEDMKCKRCKREFDEVECEDGICNECQKLEMDDFASNMMWNRELWT